MINKLDNIVIVGQGAVGLLWYHHLSQSAPLKNLTLLSSTHPISSTSESYTSHYNYTGYQQANSHQFPLIYSQKKDVESADIIILCLKSYDIASAMKNIASIIPAHCLIVLSHNGMGTLDDITPMLASKQVILAMLTTHGCLRTAQSSINHTGLGVSDIGVLVNEVPLTTQKDLTTLLNDSLPDVFFHQDIKQKQWLKLAINCVINPITAIENIENGQVNNKRYANLTHELLTELVAVAAAEGINLDKGALLSTVAQVANATKENSSSMCCDLQAGRRTEIDYINGYIHRLGVKHNIATPENTRLWQQVSAMA